MSGRRKTCDTTCSDANHSALVGVPLLWNENDNELVALQFAEHLFKTRRL